MHDLETKTKSDMLDLCPYVLYTYLCFTQNKSKVFGPHTSYPGLPRWLRGNESSRQCRRHRRLEVDPWVGKILLKRK